jgi:hypothetical protein
MSARRKAKAPPVPVYTALDVLHAARRAHDAAVAALRAVQFLDAAEALAAAGCDLEANARASGLAVSVLDAVAREFGRVHCIDYHDDWLARRRAAEARDLTPTEWVRDDLCAELLEEQAAAGTRLRSIVGPLENALCAVSEARKALGAAHATGTDEDVQRCYVEGLIAAREAVRAADEALAPRVVLRKATRAEDDATPGSVLRGDRRICDWRLERQGHVETFATREEAAARFEALTGLHLHREWLHTRLPLIAPEVRS